MSIPDYQTLMLPLLRIAADGSEHRVGEVAPLLARDLGLSDAEQTELLPSGRQAVFNSRIHWAKTYLSQAKLLQSTRRAYFRITPRGQEVLRENPAKVTVGLLDRFPEFKEFRVRARQSRQGAPVTNGADAMIDSSDAGATPDELLRSTVSDLDAALASELLDRIQAAPPAFFESLIVTLLVSMGYGGSRAEAGRAIGKSGDGGIDGVIDQDPLGLERVYLQAKRYRSDSAVSEPEIRAFSGSLGAAKANKGVFVTTSYFTGPALQFAERHPFKMVLIDGALLTTLMIRHNVGVRVAETLHLKKLDEDFFSDE